MSKVKTERPKVEYNEKAIYAGRRLSTDGKKVYQRFVKVSNGEEMLFQGVKGVWLGHTYRCSADRISARPEWVTLDQRVDNPEWEATDALVDARNAKRRADAKFAAKTKPAVKAAIEAIRPLFKNLSYFDRRALIEYLAVEASKGKRASK